MKFRNPSQKQLLLSCADVGPEDGSNPREFARKSSGRVPNRKALQLCGQVARTLGGILSGECGDEVLRNVFVESVRPAPDSSRLLVTVSPAGFAPPVEPAAVLERLYRAAGMLRREVAAAIHRRRTPELMFRVVTRGEISAV